ncbi:hypothetical protein ES703_29029 [subsurface metagenome]
MISAVIKPATELIDNLHTSDEEKLQLKNKLAEIQFRFQSNLLEYETKLMEHRADVVKAEAQGQSWLQRNWRPITMLTFLALVICDCFGLLTFRLSGEAWILLQIGLGGYVVGRSGEKIVSSLKNRKT